MKKIFIQIYGKIIYFYVDRNQPYNAELLCVTFSPKYVWVDEKSFKSLILFALLGNFGYHNDNL
jgi:hypothetical protein